MSSQGGENCKTSDLHGVLFSVALPANHIQTIPDRVNLLPHVLVFKGQSQESSYEQGDADAVCKLSREQLCFRLDCRERYYCLQGYVAQYFIGLWTQSAAYVQTYAHIYRSPSTLLGTSSRHKSQNSRFS